MSNLANSVQKSIQPRGLFASTKPFWGIGLCVIISLLVPMVITNQFYQQIFLMAFLYAGLGCAWNLVGGYAGQLSLGHAAYFGIGAYTFALFVDKTGIFVALILSALVPAIFAIPIGWLTFRLRGPYFCLGTIAFAELLRILATDQFKDLTQGSAGLVVTSLTTEPQYYYYFMVLFFVGAFLIVQYVAGSKTGYYLMAIREDEDTAQTVTVNTTLYKLIALILSALITGVGGALYASMLGTIEPDPVFGGQISNQIVFLAVLGGAGTLWGPLVGAFILEISSEFFKVYLGSLNISFLSDPNAFAFFLYGLMIVLVVLLLPDGIVGWLTRLKRRDAA